MSFEILIALPLVFGFVAGVTEMSLIMASHQRLKAASHHAARLASRPLADMAEREQVVREAIEITLEKPGLVNVYEYTLIPGQFTGDPVVVEVRVPMAAAAPDMLALIGFGLEERQLTARTVMYRE